MKSKSSCRPGGRVYRVSDTPPVAAAISPDCSTCAAAASSPTGDIFEPTLRARLPAVLFELLAPSVEFTFRVPPSTCSLALQAHVARVLQHWAALAEGAASQASLPRSHMAIVEDIKVPATATAAATANCHSDGEIGFQSSLDTCNRARVYLSMNYLT